MDKLLVHSEVTRIVHLRLLELNALLKDTFDSIAGDTKSSAGDKHETGRAMAQLEQEKLGAQCNEMSKLSEIVKRIDPTKMQPSIQMGSLVETSIGWFYLSVGIGQIQLNNQQVFCMTPHAPLGKILVGKKTGDSINWQGKTITILSMC